MRCLGLVILLSLLMSSPALSVDDEARAAIEQVLHEEKAVTAVRWEKRLGAPTAVAEVEPVALLMEWFLGRAETRLRLSPVETAGKPEASAWAALIRDPDLFAEASEHLAAALARASRGHDGTDDALRGAAEALYERTCSFAVWNDLVAAGDMVVEVEARHQGTPDFLFAGNC